MTVLPIVIKNDSLQFYEYLVCASPVDIGKAGFSAGLRGLIDRWA